MTDHRLLHDPRENVTVVRQIYKQVRVTAGGMLIVPTLTQGAGAIARDVLRGLGKHPDGRRTLQTPARLDDAARVWLQAQEITTLIIRNADRLDVLAWQSLCAMTPRSCRAWLWINPGQLTRAHASAGKRLRLQNATLNDLQALLRWPRRAQDPVLALADHTPCPTVIDADYPVFAMTCQQPGNDVTWANFIVGRAHAHWYLDRIADRPGASAIHRLLKAVAHAAPGIDAAIARFRGAQAELLLAGIHTVIDPRELRGRIAEEQLLTRPDQRAAGLLGRYAEPWIAAPSAACLASGRGPGWYLSLDERDIDADRIGDYRVPNVLKPLTRALTAVNQLQHAGWSEEPGSLLHTLDAVSAHTGVRFNRDLQPRDRSSPWTTVSYLA